MTQKELEKYADAFYEELYDQYGQTGYEAVNAFVEFCAKQLQKEEK